MIPPLRPRRARGRGNCIAPIIRADSLAAESAPRKDGAEGMHKAPGGCE